MTRLDKRSADYIDYRSRSPKRRKTSAGREQKDDTNNARQTSRAYQDDTSTSDSGTFYSARAILKRRRVGRKVEYLIDWEPNSSTGETYEPSWVVVSLQAMRVGANHLTATRGQRHSRSDQRLGDGAARKQARRRLKRPDLYRYPSCQRLTSRRDRLPRQEAKTGLADQTLTKDHPRFVERRRGRTH